MPTRARGKKRLEAFFLALFLIFSLVAIVLAGILFWYRSNLRPTPAGTEETVVITKGESLNQIAASLQEKGIIRNSLAFRIYIKINKKDTNIQAGSFKLKSGQNIDEVLRELNVGRVDKWITIPEGLRDEEVAHLFAKDFSIKEADFLKVAKEGFMFPDTYLIPIDADAAKAAEIMRANFNKKIDETLSAKFSAKGLTEEQAVILASIVERDSKNGSERPIIAGIYQKRYKEGWKLESDATVQYALGYSSEQKTWWRDNLTADELLVSSPFNTRKNLGLPPEPICNPGLSALKAVAEAEDSPYYYYLYDKSGKVHFAKTLDEHNANVANYL